MKVIAVALLFGTLLSAQSIRVYSEFQRISALGQLLVSNPREIISPAVARNAFTTFQVAVTAPPRTTYFLFVSANPTGIVTTHLYNEREPLVEVRPPGFGAIPDDATTRSYLLDVWVPPEAEPGRRVRIEVQLKTGEWLVYPMELRVQQATAPAISPTPLTLAGLAGRNAAQDLALLSASASPLPWFLLLRQTVPNWVTSGPEWVLNLRDTIYRTYASMDNGK